VSIEIVPREMVSVEPPQVSGRVPWQRLADAWLASLDSTHTQRAYRRNVTAAFEWMGAETLDDVTGERLGEPRAAVVDSGLSPASQEQALAAMRSFLRWARGFGAHRLPADLVAQQLKTPRSKVLTRYQQPRRLGSVPLRRPGHDRTRAPGRRRRHGDLRGGNRRARRVLPADRRRRRGEERAGAAADAWMRLRAVASAAG
jgi:hypothetical protein